MTRKCYIVNDQSIANYDAENEIIYNIDVLKSNLCRFNDAYIVVTGNITIVNDNRTQVAFKNCVQFTRCIAKIDRTRLDDAEDLDLVMLI